MASRPERLSALAAVYQTGEFGRRSETSPPIQIYQRLGLNITQIQAWPDSNASVRRHIADVAGIEPSENAAKSVGADALRILRAGPDAWWLVADENRRFLDDLRLKISFADAAITELGNARVVLRLSGPRAYDLLAKDCSLDFRPGKFGPGRCAQTRLGHFSLLIAGIDEAPTVDLYLPRSLSASAWTWLIEAGEEFGINVLPASRG